MSFLNDIAYAMGSPGGAGGGAAPGGAQAGAFNMVMLAAFIGVMYFFFIRPQSKRAKEQRSFIDSLKRGDKVVTAGGIFGAISSIDDAKGVVLLEIAKDTQIKIMKSQISAFQKTGEEGQKKE